jgi:hypothetical protein
MMATIVAYPARRPEKSREPAPRGAKAEACEIIIFPGVRTERPAPAKRSRTAAPRGRRPQKSA